MSRIENVFSARLWYSICASRRRMSCGMSSIERRAGEAHRRKNPRGGYAFGTGDRFRLLCGGRTRAASFIRTVGGSGRCYFQ